MGLHASQARPGRAEPWPLGPDTFPLPLAGAQKCQLVRWPRYGPSLTPGTIVQRMVVLPAGWLLMAFFWASPCSCDQRRPLVLITGSPSVRRQAGRYRPCLHHEKTPGLSRGRCVPRGDRRSAGLAELA